MTKHIKLITCESGDWQILEVNGMAVASDHRIPHTAWLNVLSEHFDCQIEKVCISDEEMQERS